ncbi:hypothetical protein LOZ53_003826 [Ophidiomyces ophidiicola]|uniref:Uncharacterized protein n=1 Tax=Ophidiomyces ophidiicola TaxID=1387563 RepID=A0ACB8V1C3_9EURO|nr:uncharacterized protein LOZ57_004340 [Ophidiomyces ophidiicola]KAI1909419.1 hypothetical protein LOZ64_005248 [Ophidiomyces ophidiicola]KAI1914884.1 hypothetical protein LOZ61_002021 [Ophidiomyces ophidiicola]KAI1924788.1 hypothetical protein LOZ60_004520 [Ophidiomyces ophidiicola]KAI1945309.1 hypothetical protein LOZ57_004340 [Ophidiomyces ophidiicola]KAI1953189.1 hypothetical protein LOZ59_005231 [Ophidiomyces ophidiicola]
MRVQLVSFAFMLIGSAVGKSWSKTEPPHIGVLLGRGDKKDSSFAPGTSPGTGKSCGDAFGAGFSECAASGVCYSAAEGDTCCKEGYKARPGLEVADSPKGLSVEECAVKLSISIKPTLNSKMPQQPSVITSQAPSPSSPAAVHPPVIVVTTTICPYPTGRPNMTTTSTIIPTVSTVPTDAPIFTGAANPQSSVQGAVFVVALLGFLRNFL